MKLQGLGPCHVLPLDPSCAFFVIQIFFGFLACFMALIFRCGDEFLRIDGKYDIG